MKFTLEVYSVNLQQIKQCKNTKIIVITHAQIYDTKYTQSHTQSKEFVFVTNYDIAESLYSSKFTSSVTSNYR